MQINRRTPRSRGAILREVCNYLWLFSYAFRYDKVAAFNSRNSSNMTNIIIFIAGVMLIAWGC